MVIFCQCLLICQLFRFGSPYCAPIMNTCLFFWLLLLVLGVYKTHKWKANASRWRHCGGGGIEIEVGSRSGRQHRDYLIYKCTWTANRYSYRYRFPAPKIQIHLQINRMYLTVCSCEGDSFYVPPHTHTHTDTHTPS